MKIINASDAKYAIENLNDPYDEPSVELFTSLMVDKMFKYAHWRVPFEEAQKCYRYFNGDILGEEKRAKLIKKGKYPVEKCEYKPFINSLNQSLIKAKPNGKVEQTAFSNPPESVSAEDMDLVLQKIKKDLRFDYNVAQASRDGLIAGYPVAIMFDLEQTQYGGQGKIELKRYPFDSVLPGRSANGDVENIKDCTITTILTYEEIKEQFPDKSKVIDQYIEDHYVLDTVITPPDNFLGVDNNSWSEITAQMTANWATFQNSNSWTVYRWIRPLTAKITRFINYSNGDVQILPKTWDEEQVQNWINENPDYEMSEEYAKVLWETTVTQTGIVLENAPSWYQNNAELPGAFFVPDVVNRKPCGIMNDLLPYIYAGAIVESEGLAQVQRGNRSTTFVQKGALEDPESARIELTKEIGLVEYDRSFEPPTEIQKRPNESYLAYADRNYAKAQQAIRVNDQMMGNISQYQNKLGIEKALSQGLEAQGTYLRNLTSFDLKLNRVILNAIPVFMTEQELIQIEDEFGNQFEVEVNQAQPQEPEQEQEPQDKLMTGFREFVEEQTGGVGENPEDEPEQGKTTAYVIANDLTCGRFVYNIIAGDYSNMTREESITKFLAFFNQGGANIAMSNPELFITICGTMPDRYFKAMAKQAQTAMQTMQEQQAQAAQAEKQDIITENQKERVFELVKEALKRAIPQVITNVRPEAIVEAPQGFEATMQYQQEGIANAVNSAVEAISKDLGTNPEGLQEQMGMGGEAQYPEQMGDNPQTNILQQLGRA